MFLDCIHGNKDTLQSVSAAISQRTQDNDTAGSRYRCMYITTANIKNYEN